jgi:Cdc6-like AAA superfamily ATPase
MSAKLGFSEWPFHTLPDEEFVKVWCGRAELQKKLDNIFTRVIKKPGFQICLIYGDFGAGKTHGIKHMMNKYRESAKLITTELEYDGTIRTFIQLYQSLANRMDLSPIQNWQNLSAKPSSRDFDFFCQNLKSTEEDKQATAKQWFSGQEKSRKILNEVGIRNPIVDTDTAVHAFSELTKLAGKNSSAIVLFIDEFQHIAKQNVNWKENILNGLTKLINESPNHVCLILSFRLRMPMNILSIIPDSMRQRFSGDPFIEFANFSREEAREFLKCLFAKFLIVKVQDDCFPFTHEGCEVILDFLSDHHVELNPRSLMKAFGYVSECFENETRIEKPPIPVEFVRKNLEAYIP